MISGSLAAETPLPSAVGAIGTACARIAWPQTVNLAQPSALEAFKNRPFVVLSPHFDDACFSLGCLLTRLGGGDIVNIFTQSQYLAPRNGNSNRDLDQRHVFAIRDSEDQVFADCCGLIRHDLGCEEPALRGRRPGGLHHLRDDIAQSTKPIITKLVKIAQNRATNVRAVLFAPLGIGRHVNHRAAAEVVLQNFFMLSEWYDVYFFEDLPYASNVIDRIRGLWHASHQKGWRLSTRYVLACDWDEKAALLDIYPTQHRRVPSPQRFSPRALSPRGLHEAFWSVAPPHAFNHTK